MLTLIVTFFLFFSVEAIPLDSCGLNKYSNTVTPFVVGGKNAELGEFPFQISLLKNSLHSCGGSIVNGRWVVTGAHCCSITNPSVWTVVAGKYNLGRVDASEIAYKVERVIKHERYSSINSHSNDIALMKLAEDIKFNDFIQPVCLADSGYQDLEKERLTVIGWGALEEGGYPADVLQKATVPVIPNTQCAGAYPRETISKTNICAGNFTSGGTDACQGDSGGPLLHLNTNGSFVQVGITSWGYGCAQKGHPGVYTRISEMYNWIWETIRKN